MSSANISETEAQIASLSIILAMLNDDKEGREVLYKDFTEEDLKRVLRWTIRIMWPAFYIAHQGNIPYIQNGIEQQLMKLANLE